jgi:hypothetical protein
MNVQMIDFYLPGRLWINAILYVGEYLCKKTFQKNKILSLALFFS